MSNGTKGSASQHTVRRHNRAVVLRVVADSPGRSRAQLADLTGLARATVSALADDLIEAGLVLELAADRGARGRPGRPLTLNPDGPASLGLEINVDYINACVLDLTGRVRARRTVVTDNRQHPPDRVLRTAGTLGQRLVGGTGLALAGVTLALPGLVDESGRVHRLPNLPGWDGVDAAARLHTRFGTPVTVRNEADAAATAEIRVRPGTSDLVLVSGEVGVGAGIVVGGSLYRGARNFAGELGHLTVDPNGPACGCGARGCLEQYVGQEALLRAAGLSGEPATLTAAPTGAATALLQAAQTSDPRTCRTLARAGELLGISLAGVVNMFDLPTVVLGGLYARLGAWLIEPITAQLRARVVSGLTTDVVVSSIGSDAAMIGAAAEVTDQLVLGAGPDWSAARGS